MERKTRIVVLHVKELIYTGIFVCLGIALILLLIFMFLPQKDKKNEVPASSGYVAGIYSTSILLNGNTIDVEVAVDNDRINSIQFVNLSESMTAMFPLLQPALDNIAEQVYETQSLENINYPDDNKYTSSLILEAIETSLEKAASLE